MSTVRSFEPINPQGRQMTPTTQTEIPSVLDARVVVPEHVVHREFPSETVVLNLSTGQYHGLNPIAGRMLRVLEAATTVRTAISELRSAYPSAGDRIDADVRELCEELARRDLITLVAERR